MKKSLFWIVVCCALIVSCTNEFYDTFMKTTDDPSSEQLTIRSFDEVDTIKISWQKDEAADFYILMRADNGNSVNIEFSEIYRGKNLSFVDDDVLDGHLYRYRLDKMRGNKLFVGEKQGLGVASSIEQGRLYDNSTMEKAFLLTHSTSSTSYFYAFDDNTELVDFDWYCVDVKMRGYEEFLITYNNKTTEAWFEYFVPGFAATKIQTGESIRISNETDELRRIYFAIRPIKKSFCATIPGGDTRSYTLKNMQGNN